ncbi:MAG: nucleotide exchange factor GrpE, partial [Planctomycetota bacterium]
AEKDPDFTTLLGGLKIVRAAIWNVLADAGFERIDAGPGVPFDPEVHDAILQLPHEAHPQGAIVEELASGYRLGELILRPSKVVVSAGAGPERPTERSGPEPERPSSP